MDKKRSQEWRKQFDERDQKEIAFAEVYLRNFGHGTPGHLHLMLIAKLAYALDDAEQREGEMMSPTIESFDGTSVSLE